VIYLLVVCGCADASPPSFPLPLALEKRTLCAISISMLDGEEREKKKGKQTITKEVKKHPADDVETVASIHLSIPYPSLCFLLPPFPSLFLFLSVCLSLSLSLFLSVVVSSREEEEHYNMKIVNFEASVLCPPPFVVILFDSFPVFIVLLFVSFFGFRD